MEWNPRGNYRVNDIVQYHGNSYRCIQAHQGYGDPNWNPESFLAGWVRS